MRKFKRGFTLVEILIAMALVAILVAVMSPNIARIRPDQKKALFIKAYTRTEIAVVNMLNDTEMYPTTYDENGNLATYGLCSTAAPVGLLGSTDSKSGEYKFVYYFAKELGSTNTENTVTTSDQITYSVDFQNSNVTDIDATAATITVSAKIRKNLQNEDVELGTITVKNNGNVSCGSDTTCQTYMEDRYNLRVSE